MAKLQQPQTNAQRRLSRRELLLGVIPEDETISFEGAGFSNGQLVPTEDNKDAPSQANVMELEKQDRNESLALTNRERMANGLSPLQQSVVLNGLASLHAGRMASEGRLRFSVGDIGSLRRLLGSDHVAINIQRGASVRELHEHTMTIFPANRENILSATFNEHGAGFVRGRWDGMLYSCQYFRFQP